MKKKTKRYIWLGAALLVLIAGIAVWRYLIPYEPADYAVSAMASADGVSVDDNDNWISFEPSTVLGTAVIFYPGALVEPEAYAPLARRVTAAGHPFYIAKMPLNLAVIKGDAADDIIRVHPQQSFVIGGHSLGGVMASRFAADHADELKGVFFLASYPDSKGSLKDTALSVLSILGTEDTVINRKKFSEGRSYLPSNTVYDSINGGNHAQFGSYGPQKGDGEATITEEEQQSYTAHSMLDWLGNLQ